MSKYKILSITYARPHKDSHIFSLKLEDDKRDITFWSKKNPCELKEGEEVEGDIEVKVVGNYTNYTLKLKNTSKFVSGGGANPEITKKVAALTQTVVLICAGKCQIDKLEESFDKMMVILNKP